MKILDINLLLYAVDAHSDFHQEANTWWSESLVSNEPIGLPWHTIVGFLRLATSARILQQPLAEREAVAMVAEWLQHPSVRIVAPAATHWRVLSELILDAQCRANLISDAHLAALAIEHGATLCSTDADFSRFPGLKWLNPLAPKKKSR